MAPKDDIETIREVVATFADGKLDRKDAQAVVSLLGALAGLASAVVLTLQGLGIL